MPATVRVGIAGVQRGAVLHRALALYPGCEVVAVCSLRASHAQQYAAEHGVARAYDRYEALLADRDVDAIVVATPAAQHAPQAIAALAAGKHVLSEVPAAWMVEECGALIEAAR